MERIEYRDVIDKSGWPQGPWMDEPDKIQWPDEETNLPCLIIRNSQWGALCGYVGVPYGHNWYGARYQDVYDGVDVHGGLTFSGPCSNAPEIIAICHKPAPGEPADVWWFGFDCNHDFDLAPAFPILNGEYRDLAYVTEQVRRLAGQLAACAIRSAVS